MCSHTIEAIADVLLVIIGSLGGHESPLFISFFSGNLGILRSHPARQRVIDLPSVCKQNEKESKLCLEM